MPIPLETQAYLLCDVDASNSKGHAVTPPTTAPFPAASDPTPATRDMLAHALLTAHDEVTLAKRMETGVYAAHLLTTGDHPGITDAELQWLVSDGQAARALFIESNLRLAMSTARRYRKRGLTEDDVIQDAYHGLVKAVDRFDYTKGFKFSTFAVWWIRESIFTGIREAGVIKHPEVLFNNISKIRAVRARLTEETGSDPTIEALAAEVGLPESMVQRCLREDRPVASLQFLIGEDYALGDSLPDEAASERLVAVEDAADRTSMVALLTATLARLPEADAAIVRARFGLDGREPRGVSQVAAELGISRQTVRMKEQRALARLRHPQTRSSLAPFLRPTG